MTVKIKTPQTFKTSISTEQSKRRNFSKNLNLYQHPYVNLKPITCSVLRRILRTERDREREGIYFRIGVKGKVVPVHAKKAYRGSIVIVLVILNLASF